MAGLPAYTTLTLVPATPATLGEIAIDGNGQILVHNGATVDTYGPVPPVGSVMALAASGQSLANGATTISTFGLAATMNIGSGFTATVSGIQVAASGQYQIIGNLIFNANTGSTARELDLTIDGATVVSGRPVGMAAGASINAIRPGLSVAQEVTLTAGKVVGLSAYQNSGAAISLYYAQLTVRKLG